MDITQSCKADAGKPRLALVPPAIRYRDALMRHVCAYLRDPGGTDAESGLPHLAHAACNIAFLLELEGR